jgi:tellurite resistance-related uncharacterized protein
VLSVVNAAFAGLTSIRAFGAQQMFTDRSTARIDEYTRITVVFGNLNRYEVDDTAHAPFHHAFVDGSPFAFRYVQNNHLHTTQC